MAASARPTSSMLSGRPAGSFASRRATRSSSAAGTSGRSSRTRGASSRRILGQDRHDVRARERRLAGEALEEDRSDGEEVGARVELLVSARLLGGHVARRSDQRSGAGHRRVGRGQTGEARDAEVEQLDPCDVSVGQKEVGRLDVTMDDAALVRLRQRGGDARAQLDGLEHRERPFDQTIRERLALEPLHRDEVFAALALSVGDVADDPRVVEPRQQHRLAGEALRVGLGLDVEPLDRDPGAGLQIEGGKDRAHPARADLALDLEAPDDGLAWLHDECA